MTHQAETDMATVVLRQRLFLGYDGIPVRRKKLNSTD